MAGSRFQPDRPELHRSQVLLGPPFGHRADALQRQRLQLLTIEGPLNPALVDAVKGRIEALKAADPDNKLPIPADLVNASACIPTLARKTIRWLALPPSAICYRPTSRRWSANTSKAANGASSANPWVNVLQLNIALDSLHRQGGIRWSTIAKLLSTKDIRLDMDVSRRGQSLMRSPDTWSAEHGMPKEWVFQSLSRREKIGSTALGSCHSPCANQGSSAGSTGLYPAQAADTICYPGCQTGVGDSAIFGPQGGDRRAPPHPVGGDADVF